MYLLDTNHCSNLILGNPTLIRKVLEVGESNIATSAITEGELVYMVENSRQREENIVVLDRFLQDIPVYGIDEETGRIYGSLKAQIMARFGPKERSKRRRTRTVNLGIDENDLWIASIALQHGFTIVSADNDFRRIREARDFPLETWYAPSS